MVPAKCPQCGAAIELNEKNDTGVCPYCGTTFVMREAVNNYNTYVTANISADRENGDALLGILKEQTDKDYENVCRPLYEAGMLSELRASAEKIIADSPASPIGYKYMIMSFPEYKYRGTDKYNEILGEHLAKDAETHPIAQYYVIMKNLLDTDEKKEKYKTVTSTAARIIEDYDKTVIGFFQKKLLSVNKIMAVAAILTAVTLFLSIFCLIQAAFVNPLLALPAVLSIACLLVCSYIAVAAHKKKKAIEEKTKNKNRNRI